MTDEQIIKQLRNGNHLSESELLRARDLAIEIYNLWLDRKGAPIK
jgi:hypothetical protein